MRCDLGAVAPAAVGQVRRRPLELHVHVGHGIVAAGGRLEHLLGDAVARRVEGVRHARGTARHAGESAVLRVGHVAHAVAGRPDAELVLHGERDRVAEAALRAAADRLDLAAARQAHELLAAVADHVRERPVLDHRPQRAVGVVGGVLGERCDLDERGRARHAHRLAPRVGYSQPHAQPSSAQE